MKHRGGKDHQSDDEGDGDEGKGKALVTQQQPLSAEEIERQQLENEPVIADSEISPAAYLFQH